MNSNNKDKVVSRIIETYEKNLFSLPLTYQQHWCLRLYRLNKNTKYLQSIWTDFQIKTLYAIPKIMITRDEEEGQIGERILQGYKLNSEKKRLRVSFYKKYPAIIYNMSIIHYLFVAKSLGMDKIKDFDEIYDRGIKRLKAKDWKKVLASEEFVRVNPSALANTVYYLKFLGICDLEEETISLFKNVWLNMTPESEIDWHNKIYALTHIVIAASYFYQVFLSSEKFEWILNFFEKNINEIIKNTNPDIIAEVGLCFKLCRKDDSEAGLVIKEFIISKFSEEKGYIPREKKDTLELAEHRNVLAVLFLSSYEELNMGPDMSIFMKTNEKSLYIPEKGKSIGIEEFKD